MYCVSTIAISAKLQRTASLAMLNKLMNSAFPFAIGAVLSSIAPELVKSLIIVAVTRKFVKT